MVAGPDSIKETFQQNQTCVSQADSSAKPDNLDVVFVENCYDPDPADDQYEATLVYLIRKDGKLRVETDRHILGLFTLDKWHENLRKAGFSVHAHQYSEGGKDYVTFACLKPQSLILSSRSTVMALPA